jgi:hypothetical protein
VKVQCTDTREVGDLFVTLVGDVPLDDHTGL